MMNAYHNKTLLAIYAHPDDEVLGSGGTLAHAAANGARVAVVSATRGEAGEIHRDAATRETLAQVREQEMRCSALALGISDLLFLDYRDSGMEGAPDNEHPRALVNAPAADVRRQLAKIIRTLRPDAVITFEPYGGYGHPDHKAIHRHTVGALEDAANDAYRPDLGGPWQTPRLYYHLIPRAIFREMRRRVAALGSDTSDFDELLSQLPPEAWPEDKIHVVVDVYGAADKKLAAWNCHRSQFGPDSRFRRLPESEMMEILSTEYFAMARPEPRPGVTHSDLFW